MLNRLKQKWGVGPFQLFLILCTFAIGGSLSGYAGRFLLSQAAIANRALYIIVYILVVTLIWPFMVLGVSIVFGQFRFFKKYLGQLLKKITGRNGSLILLTFLSVLS
ncbi:DUF6787 family protein [Niabella ginsengisoli]|uniref:DUF6787 domain-containing protein n=1 Tax=Niabella ginsengisoli TaxID=522298 RepID=A0ABS9SN23_9BACT|nr:DUF6787 family protein [Niabella ginsengisoli]MCH5599754.1 hypothetical protein [Niabella ginsengisoli]